MTNPRELARQAIVAKVESLKALFTDYNLLVEYANGDVVNTALQKNPYLKVRIVYQDGSQIDLGEEPGHRLIGTIVIEACVKEGSGTKQANDLLNHFYPYMHMTDKIPPVRTLAARFASRNAVNGWVAEAAIIPFWVDAFSIGILPRLKTGDSNSENHATHD